MREISEENVHGVTYNKAKVNLLHSTPLALSEIGARTCYNSFRYATEETILNYDTNNRLCGDIDDSELVHNLVHTNHHESIVEHINFTFSISKIGRGVLQELSRHRIASYSVKSSRYTGSVVLNAFNASNTLDEFIVLCPDDTFIVVGWVLTLEKEDIYNKLLQHRKVLGVEEFIKLTCTKNQIVIINTDYNYLKMFKELMVVKQKRNVLDPFKYLVTDNWSTDIIMTINARSMMNFMKLRDSGAAWFQIEWLAKSMKEVIPESYKKVLWKNK